MTQVEPNPMQQWVRSVEIQLITLLLSPHFYFFGGSTFLRAFSIKGDIKVGCGQGGIFLFLFPLRKHDDAEGEGVILGNVLSHCQRGPSTARLQEREQLVRTREPMSPPRTFIFSAK